jgi:LexA-binding, inner membrane-associated putative hydrolase
MLVGHLAVGFVAKWLEPEVSLGTFVFAALLADFVCFVLLILGIERFEPVPGAEINRAIGHHIYYSHSLLMLAVWGALFTTAWFFRRHYPRGAWLIFGAVLSHWVLDTISHRADMSLVPGVPILFGLKLWNSLPATLLVEGGFWLVAIVAYVRATRARNWAARVLFWIVVVLITLIWIGNIRAGLDPNLVRAGISGLIFFGLVVAWTYWMNRVRPARD